MKANQPSKIARESTVEVLKILIIPSSTVIIAPGIVPSDHPPVAVPSSGFVLVATFDNIRLLGANIITIADCDGTTVDNSWKGGN